MTTNDIELLTLIAPALNASAFRSPRRWGAAVVILRAEERRVTSRADFAHWLRANDLAASARECLARKVPAGHLLVWTDIDTATIAAASFVVVDLARALRAASAVT